MQVMDEPFFKVPKDSKVFKVFKKAPFHREKVTVKGLKVEIIFAVW